MIDLIILTLATLGFSYMLVNKDGFMDVFYKLRTRRWLKMLTCMVCTSVWVAIVFSIFYLYGYAWLLTPLAVVGAIVIIEEYL